MKYYVDHTVEYVHADGWKYTASPDPDTDGAYVKIRYYEWDRANKQYVEGALQSSIPPEILAHLGPIAHTIARGLEAEEIG